MISIIIPTYNESQRIGKSLEKLANFLKTQTREFEIIVVDDASTDNTSEIVASFRPQIPNLNIIRLDKSPFAGKGLAVNKAMLVAKGDIAIFTDADFSTPIEEIDKLISKLNEGYDIAIGSRALDRSTVQKKQNFIRRLMGRTFNLLVQILAVRGITDTQCGFKAFKMPVCKSLFEEEKIFDFGFDVEILYLAKKRGLKIAEVPVLWFNDPRTTVNPIRDSILMFLDLIKIRLYHSPKEGSLTDKLFFYLYTYRTFWRFSIVGVTNTILDYSLFYILTRYLFIDPLVANPISVESAIIWSFSWNSIWTFSERKTNKPLWLRFFIFQFVSLGALWLSQISLLLLNKYLGIYDLLAKGLTIPIVLVFNYLLNSRWTFKEGYESKYSWYIYILLIVSLLVVFTLLASRI